MIKKLALLFSFLLIVVIVQSCNSDSNKKFEQERKEQEMKLEEERQDKISEKDKLKRELDSLKTLREENQKKLNANSEN